MMRKSIIRLLKFQKKSQIKEINKNELKYISYMMKHLRNQLEDNNKDNMLI